VSVHYLYGSGEALLLEGLGDLVHALVGGGDRALIVEDLDGDDYPLDAVVAAARTPPFLTESRVVVARKLQRFFPRARGVDASADAVFDDDDEEPVSGPAPGNTDLTPLVVYLADPNPTTHLVLVATKAAPKKLLDALKAAGAVIRSTDVGTGKARTEWLGEHLALSPVRLDTSARALIGERLGEDLGRLSSLFDMLQGTFGEGARLTADDVAPFLGEGGGVPPWDLTDAIDKGHVDTALVMLHRMLHAGDRHPLQVMAILNNHYGRMLRLDGSGAHDERAAADVLNVKGSTYPARKALEQLRKLGHAKIVQAIQYLARADLDLRGARDWPSELVMEVLVARLGRLTRDDRKK